MVQVFLTMQSQHNEAKQTVLYNCVLPDVTQQPRMYIYILRPNLLLKSLVTHDQLSKVILVVEKGLVLISDVAAGWRVYLALVGKGLNTPLIHGILL